MRLSAAELRDRSVEARDLLARCVLCGHRCEADRRAGRLGRCECGSTARVAAALLHPGEEPALGPHAGAVFFSGCNLRCVYCQNWQISQAGKGEEVTAEMLAGRMLRLRDEGAANIDLVSPTPWVPHLLEALAIAADRGLDLPVVYNTGGYDSPEALSLVDGAVDVYLPDMRHSDGSVAARLSGAADYPRVNRAAVLEMYRQVGDVEFNDAGQAVRGLIIRLLVLPHGLAGVCESLSWMAEHLSLATWFSLMAQYRPEHRASEYPELSGMVSEGGYRELTGFAEALGFENFYVQSPDSREALRPDFDRPDPFGRRS